MAESKKRVFISFDYDYDLDLKNFLVGQSKHEDSPFEITDYSVKEHLSGDWKEKARAKIKQAGIVCIIPLAAWYGGAVVAVMGADGLTSARFAPPKVGAAVIVPEIVLATAEARALIPDAYDRADAVHNVQRAALLGAALASGRVDLLRAAVRDRLHQPYRAALIPGLEEMLALDDPALVAVALSGAGPSVLALTHEESERIGRLIAAVFARHGVRSSVLTPPLAWFVLLYLAALVVLLITAFWQINPFTTNIEKVWSVTNFSQIFASPAYRGIIGRTIGMAAAVTVTDAVVAFPFAYYMARIASSRTRTVLFVAILLPLWASYLAKVYSWLLIFTHDGTLDWSTLKIGLGQIHLLYTNLAAATALCSLCLPFILIPGYASLERMLAKAGEQLLVLGVRSRKAALNVVEAQPVAGAGYPHLGRCRKRHRRTLRPVAQRCVVDDDPPIGHKKTSRHCCREVQRL